MRELFSAIPPIQNLSYNMNPTRSTFTFTFGDCAENHTGMEQIGKRGAIGDGFALADLAQIQKKFVDAGATCIIYNLTHVVAGASPAYVLVVKKGVDIVLGPGGAAKLFEEQAVLDMDKKAFMYGRVVNKKARWNLCFDDMGHEPDYEKAMGRVVAYKDLPVTKGLVEGLPAWFGEKATGLKGEANYYYDITKCGIGFHGDTERRKVVAARVGAALPLQFQWFQHNEPIGSRMELPLEDGDMYVMSEKAVGTDWKSSSLLTLRHATGCEEFTTI